MFILFLLLWILMAGEASVHILLWGAAASLLMCWFCRRMLGYRAIPLRRIFRKFWGLIRYLWHLLAEMLKAGFVVMRLIYTRGRNMEPVLVWFDTTVKSDHARAALANSITLTAGTITVSAEDGRFCVHALDQSLARSIEDCGFQRRLDELEAP